MRTGDLLLLETSIFEVQLVQWSSVGLERQGLPDRRDVHVMP